MLQAHGGVRKEGTTDGGGHSATALQFQYQQRCTGAWLAPMEPGARRFTLNQPNQRTESREPCLFPFSADQAVLGQIPDSRQGKQVGTH